MEFNPNSSWAVTCNQMWNLSMTNPIRQNQYVPRRGNEGNSSGAEQNLMGNQRKLEYCWSFNKGAKCKFGKKCKFIEKCSYCDSHTHGVVNCKNLDRKDREGNNHQA